MRTLLRTLTLHVLTCNRWLACSTCWLGLCRSLTMFTRGMSRELGRCYERSLLQVSDLKFDCQLWSTLKCKRYISPKKMVKQPDGTLKWCDFSFECLPTCARSCQRHLHKLLNCRECKAIRRVFVSTFSSHRPLLKAIDQQSVHSKPSVERQNFKHWQIRFPWSNGQSFSSKTFSCSCRTGVNFNF